MDIGSFTSQLIPNKQWIIFYTQLTFTCSKSTIETLEKGVKYVCSALKKVLMSYELHLTNYLK